MQIAHSRPTGITWTLASSSTGEAWVSSDAGDDLTNNRPGLGSIVQWCGGTQTTASYTELRAAWAAGTTIGLVALLGVEVPAGTLVQALGRSAGGSSWDIDMGSARVITRARGENVVVIDTRATTALLDGIAFRIRNDVNGAADIPASFAFRIGEAFFGPSHHETMSPEWEQNYNDTTVNEYSTTGQNWNAVGVQYWTLGTKPAPRRRAAMFDGASVPESFIRLVRSLDRSQPVIIVPRDHSAVSIQESALYGVVTEINGFRHMVGEYYMPGSITLREIPVPV